MNRAQRTHLVVENLVKSLNKKWILGCEVGVWKGELSKHLLEKFPHLFLYMVDFYQKHSYADQEETSQALLAAQANTFLFADRRALLVTTSAKASSLIPDRSLHFVYIDANHTYNYVKQDLELWYPKITREGILCGHDYGGVGDKKGFFGVKKAVDEFVMENKLKLTIPGSLVWHVRRAKK